MYVYRNLCLHDAIAAFTCLWRVGAFVVVHTYRNQSDRDM